MARILKYEGATVKVVGDAHLGRKFMNGVPLHRRGEREAMMWNQFYNEMMPTDGANAVVNVGDIFDKAVVGYDVIMKTARIVREHAYDNPSVKFIVLAGNHDLSKDTEKVSAFLVLKALLADMENVYILDDTKIIQVGERHLAFFPYSVEETAAAVVQEVVEVGVLVTAAFGHWDTTDYGGDNTMPHNELSKITGEAYTGHIHSPGVIIETESYRAEKIGSMQPYAHGEETDESLYVTRTLDQLDGSEDFTNRCLRVVLKPGEDIPSVECLQLTVKRVDDAGEEVESMDVTFDVFSMDRLFSEAMGEAGVVAGVVAKIQEKFTEMRGVQ